MFVGGAHSADRQFRTSGYDWWPQEQLTEDDLGWIIERYLRTKPAVMVTHDCPVGVAPLVNSHHSRERTRTSNSLQLMWEAHQPELWIFGHHHVSFDRMANRTRFVCLAELEARNFDLPLLGPAPVPDAAC
jgi:Icc-related predicted phosphoesterase